MIKNKPSQSHLSKQSRRANPPTLPPKKWDILAILTIFMLLFSIIHINGETVDTPPEQPSEQPTESSEQPSEETAEPAEEAEETTTPTQELSETTDSATDSTTENNPEPNVIINDPDAILIDIDELNELNELIDNEQESSENPENNQEEIQDNSSDTILINIDELIDNEQESSENSENNQSQKTQKINQTQEANQTQETTSNTSKIKNPTTETTSTTSSSQTTSLSSEKIQTQEDSFEYIDIDTLTNETQKTTETESSETPNTTEKEKLICFKNSEKAFEGELAKDINCNNIEKEDNKISENKKEVTIKSNEHVEDPITVYTDIPEITEEQKSGIKINWKNKDKEITSIQYYDTNDNELYDQISWIVPHLSEQIFEITINLTIQNISPTIKINPIDLPSGEESNPIKFEFVINYTGSAECTLTIDSSQYNFSTENISFNSTNLENGNHNWSINCSDNIPPSISDYENGSFSISQNLSLTLPNNVYLISETINPTINANQGDNTLTITNSNSETIYQETTSESSYTFTINPGIINETGNYQINLTNNGLVKPISIIKDFSIINMSITTNTENISTNQNIETTIDINPSNNIISMVALKSGNNEIYHNNNESQNTITKTLTHSYTQTGAHTLNLNAVIGGRYFEIRKQIQITSNGDNQAPEIDMLDPVDNEIIKQTSITFVYKPSDNVKIKNCTFDLFNNSGIYGNLEYSETVTNPTNNQNIEVRLTNFEEGKYSWIVECYDNSSNYEYESRDFEVSFSNTTIKTASKDYINKEEIEQAIEVLEDFMVKKKSFSFEEIKALDELKITEDLKYYQKRLEQIKADLSTNLKYVLDNELRQERENEMIEEFEEIQENIPQDIEIIEKKEFVKNSITDDLEKIIEDYLEYEKLSKINAKRLTKSNHDLQKYLKTTTQIKKIKIKYQTGDSKEITLTTKEIELKNNNGEEIIIEIIPEKINKEIIFLTKSETIKDNEMYTIWPSDLEENKLSYYTESFVDIEELEKTETVLFKQDTQKAGITGYFFYEVDTIGITYYILAGIILLIMAIGIVMTYRRKSNIEKWKKDENMKKIFQLRKELKANIENKQFISAKEKYKAIREIFPLASEECRKFLYKDLKKINLILLRKDVLKLIKNYQQAKTEHRTYEAHEIYKKIKEKYSKLPKKYKEKVYNKIFTQEEEL